MIKRDFNGAFFTTIEYDDITITYYFGSESKKTRFEKMVNEKRDYIILRIFEVYQMILTKHSADLILYKKIEKRGFKVKYKIGEGEWQNLSSGDQLTLDCSQIQ